MHEPAPPEIQEISVAFAKTLAAGAYEQAHSMLLPEYRTEWPPHRLQEHFERMIQFGVVTEICPLEGYARYPDSTADDLGGMYVSIVGHEKGNPIMTFSEAVMVFVRKIDGLIGIHRITWYRP